MEDEKKEELEVEMAESQSAPPAENQSAGRTGFLTIKFNHEELLLDEKTAKELAQKGLNYDKLKARLDELSVEKAEDTPQKDELKAQLEKVEKQLTLLEEEWKKERENNQNAKTSASSVGSFGTLPDDGLYTEEQLNSLSTSEIRKNLDKALRSMSFISKHKK